MNCFGKKMTSKKSVSLRSKVMKRAHVLKKKSKTRTFKTALRMAWKEQRSSSSKKKKTVKKRTSCFG